MNVEPRNRQETMIVRIGGTLDFLNAADFKALCLEQMEAGTRHFILDFSGTAALGSTGLGAIFSLYLAVSPMNGQVVFASASSPVQEVVRIRHIDKIFAQFPTVQAAREALSYNKPYTSAGVTKCPRTPSVSYRAGARG